MRLLPSSLLWLCVGAPLAAQLLPPVRFIDITATGSRLTSDVAFGSNLNPWTNVTDTLKLDVWEPQGDTSAKRPVFVYVHGGEWWYGDKTDGPVRLVLENLAVRGWVGLAINYRLALVTTPNRPQVCPPIVAEDAKAAVRWARKNAAQYRLDPDRIAIGGDSVGANASLLAAYTTWEGSSGNPGFPSRVQCVVDFWGRWVTTINDPEVALFIVHGDQDQANDYVQNAVRMRDEAKQAGAFHELFTLVGGGHSPWERWTEFLEPSRHFLYEALRLNELAGLDAVPGWSSPGVLTLVATGWKDDQMLLFLSNNRVSLPIPGLGTLCLDPSFLVLLWSTTLPSTPRVSTKWTAFQVPGAFSAALHTQVLYVRGTSLLRLSNCFTAQF